MRKKKLSRTARRELLAALRSRYRRAAKLDKGKVLDEFVSLTGYNRSYATRLLGESSDAATNRKVRSANRIYGEAVKESLIVLWEASDRICSKRLQAILPNLIESLEGHGHLQLDPDLKSKLLTISPASIDRKLKPVRKTAGSRRRNPHRRNRHHAKVPIRTFADWHGPDPGYLEIDLVAHCGGNMAGSFIQSLSVTDVASGWVEAIPLLARERTLVTEALEVIAGRVPFPILGIDSDNDSAFICQTLIDYCQEREIEFTRSRTYRFGRSGLHRTEERRRRTPLCRLRAHCRPHRRTDPGPTLCLSWSLHQFLPTLLQTDLQAALWGQDSKALRPSPNSLPAPDRSPRCCRKDQGGIARPALPVGSALPAQRDQSGPIGPGHIGIARGTKQGAKG